MPALPPDPTAAGSAANPARTRLQSPLAAAMRGRVYHLRRQAPPPQRRRQLLAMVGAVLVHVFFLFGFVLGAAFQPLLPPPPRSEQMLQVRLIEPPEPPPPPAVRGTPPKERGPRHQGRRVLPATHHERRANTAAVIANAPAAPASPVIATARQAPALRPKPGHATPPAAVLPAPAPQPKSVNPAGEPPALGLPIPTPLPPAPAPFQPQPMRPPQLEGNRPILPPTSLALRKAAVPVAANLPIMAIHMDGPQTAAAVRITPAPQPATAPDLPRLQPLPLPAQPAPTVVLQAPPLTPPLIAPEAVNEPQARAASPNAPAAATVASASAPPEPLPLPKLELNPLSRAAAVPPVLLQASSASIAVAEVTPPASVPMPASAPDSSAAPSAAAVPKSASETTPPGVASDVSRAPNAIPQGSDTATVGEPAGAASAPPTSAALSASRRLETGATSTGTHGKSLAAGKPGGDRPGAMQGASRGAVGEYVQLKPTGDTEIMRRGAPDIGYQRTRFDKDWTPEDESSLDTALRRAVEKTTVKHTVHLPRGVRVECAVKPLLPIALFSCRNPDPPALPVADKIYDPMHLAPAEPLAPPVTTSGTPAPPTSVPAPMIKFDHRAECAAARISGGPRPPACLGDEQQVRTIHAPASSASSWVPASDQFQ